jgi:hypothetical protein
MRFRIYFNHNLENNNRLKFIHSAARCRQREEKAKSRFSRQLKFSHFPFSYARFTNATCEKEASAAKKGTQIYANPIKLSYV